MRSAGPGDDQTRFLADLRALRDSAAIGYEELAARAHYPSDVLKEAENGPYLPGLPVLAAYVRACNGNVPEWEERWRRLGDETRADPNLPVRPAGASAAAVAGARAGIGVAPPEPYDPERIRAALRGGQVGSAAESRTSQPDPLGAEAPGLGRPSWDAGTGQETSVGWDTNSSNGTAWDTATGGRSGWDTAAEAGAGAGLDAVSGAKSSWDTAAEQGNGWDSPGTSAGWGATTEAPADAGWNATGADARWDTAGGTGADARWDTAGADARWDAAGGTSTGWDGAGGTSAGWDGAASQGAGSGVGSQAVRPFRGPFEAAVTGTPETAGRPADSVDRTADPADHTPLGNDRGSLAADRGWLAGREAFAGDRGPVAGGRGSLAGDAGREVGERSRNVQADPFSSAWLRDGGVASRQEEAASPRLEPAHLRGGELGVGDLSQGIGAATAAQPWDTLAPAEPARAAATMVPEPRGRHRDRVVPVRLVVVIVLAALIGSMLMLLLL